MTPPLLITIAQECFTVKIIFLSRIRVRLVGSNNTNLGVVAHGALELDMLQFGRRYFFSDPCVLGYIF